MARLSVAVSGGGHRATLFALGALQYLADAGRNIDTVSIASVSGGSLTNGFVGQQVNFRTVDGDQFETSVSLPLLKQITAKGTFFAPWTTKVYLAGLIGGFAAALVAPWLVTGIHWALRLLLCVLGLAVVGVVAGFRGRVCRAAFRRALFSPNGSSTPLSAMHQGTDHVLCSTELRSGDQFYFTHDLAYGYQFGCGAPNGVDIASAVAASAAFPGAFPPLPIPIGPLDLRGGAHQELPSHLHLVDGGVYDNMGDQWASGYASRIKRLPDRYAERVPDELLVINASAGSEWLDRRGITWPLSGEIVALKAVQGIQYDNTTAHRRSALIDQFQHAEATGSGLRGAYVGINQSPFRVADVWNGPGERGERARDVIAALGDSDVSREAWVEVARKSAGEKTHLSKMPVDRAASIVHHAYVVTMCNAHVILGSPLLDVPERSRFEVP